MAIDPGRTSNDGFVDSRSLASLIQSVKVRHPIREGERITSGKPLIDLAKTPLVSDELESTTS